VTGKIAVIENDRLSRRALATLVQVIPETVRIDGVTQTTFRQDAQLEVANVDDARVGRACFRPQAHVDLAMRPMTVCIAGARRWLPQGNPARARADACPGLPG
jgi:hypothetical protein